MALIVGNVDERLNSLETRMGKVEQTLDHMLAHILEMHQQNKGKADRTFRAVLLGFTSLTALGVVEIIARFLH